MKLTGFGWIILLFLIPVGQSEAANAPISDASQECLDCHATIHPAIVADWRQSQHAGQTLKTALKRSETARRVSPSDVEESLKNYAVGCAECHLARSEAHSLTFEHNGHMVHTVVSPDDCALCHSTETMQYRKNIMSHAHGNLADNPVYQQLQSAIIDLPSISSNGKLVLEPADQSTQAQTCYHCHGTRIESKGTQKRDTIMGEMEFPVLEGWPNQGVGRINSDGSKGSCSACHTRHHFSIAMARKPDTCKQCHVGPDVPAAKVYEASKHGNIYASMHGKWNFNAVPWTIGEDFTAPTCSACHMSLLVNPDGEMICARTHQMNDRLPHRLYGLIYAHNHPQKADTTIIRNQEGLPLPTSLDGKPARKYLISSAQGAKRLETMQAACLNCHAGSWVTNHFKRLETAISGTNQRVKTATVLMNKIWQKGWAEGLPQKANPFDDVMEKKWTEIWLFQANSIRFAAAMAGGGDYGVFADGRYQLSTNISELDHWIKLHEQFLTPNPDH